MEVKNVDDENPAEKPKLKVIKLRNLKRFDSMKKHDQDNLPVPKLREAKTVQVSPGRSPVRTEDSQGLKGEKVPKTNFEIFKNHQVRLIESKSNERNSKTQMVSARSNQSNPKVVRLYKTIEKNIHENYQFFPYLQSPSNETFKSQKVQQKEKQHHS